MLKGNSLEDRVSRLQELMKSASENQLRTFEYRRDVLWIYHDSALEGVVYTMEELQNAVSDKVVSDSALIPVYDEIRNHLEGLRVIREWRDKKKFTITLDVIKELFALLAPEELEGKTVKYRKDVPLHRLYFHEIEQPDKISYRMRQLVQWLNAPETKRSSHAVRLASKAHYQLLHTYPFPKHSGKVARLIMNLILMRAGYPPAIIHATERQRYYEALRNGEDATADLIHEALGASVESTIAYFSEKQR